MMGYIAVLGHTDYPNGSVYDRREPEPECRKS